jgi:MoaA/NifB/PqqE/SkfB family radical SAM enzyme
VTEPFSCTAGVNFAVADSRGDVFLCTNFMRAAHPIKLGNLYEGISLRDERFRCTEAFCICPQYKFDPGLYDKVVRPNRWFARHVPYDLWLHWYVTDECFLSCVYCEAGNRPFVKKNVRRIDIPALIRTLDNLNRTVHLSFTGGGEPFAVPNMTDACAAITRRHYISFNSNLLGIDMARFLSAIDPRKLLYIQGSLHLKELERTRNIERFARNYRACRSFGVKVNVVAVGIPSVIPEIPKFKEIFSAEGVEFTFAPFSGVYEGRSYPDAYTDADLKALGMSPETARTHKVEDPASSVLAKVRALIRSGVG